MTDLSDATDCEAVMTTADPSVPACTYINTATGGGSISGGGEGPITTCSSVTEPCSSSGSKVLKTGPSFILATDTDGRVLEGEDLIDRCCEDQQGGGETCESAGITCENSVPIDNYQHMSISEITDDDDDAKQDRCCKRRTGYCIKNNNPEDDFNGKCDNGYTLTTDENKIKGDSGAENNNCCDKTGFCGGNVDGIDDGFKGKCHFYEYKDDSAVGTTRGACCKISVFWIITWITSILFLIGVSVYSFKKGGAWVSLGTITVISCFSLIGFGVYNLVL